MAKHRMIYEPFINKPNFLSLPHSTRCLYFYFIAIADDDGFINNRLTIIQNCGASEQDYKQLINDDFIIEFETGVCVIRHWLWHNKVPKDRYHETDFLAEKSQLKLSDLDGKTYELINLFTKNVNETCLQNENKKIENASNDSLSNAISDKESQGKESAREKPVFSQTNPTDDEIELFCELNDKTLIKSKSTFDLIRQQGNNWQSYVLNLATF